MADQTQGIRAELHRMATTEFFASSPDVGEGVAGLRIARDSEFGILAVYKSTDTYNFEDGTGTACLLMDVDGNVTLTDAALILNGTLGYIALGNPAPTHTGVGTWTGTGIGIDRAGIVGLAASVTQASFSAATGKITAGAGTVTLDDTGIVIAGGLSDVNGVKWYENSQYVATMFGDYNGGTCILLMQSLGVANTGLANSEIQAAGLTGYNINRMTMRSHGDTYGTVGLRGWQTTQFTGSDLTKFGVVIGGTNGATPSSLLHLASTAPTFRMEDTTSSAKGLLVTVDANLATFEEVGGTDILVMDLANARVGINYAAPSFPLSFGTGLGNKIALYDVGSGAGYGFGIQGNLLQIFSNSSADAVAIGYGNSGSFTQGLNILNGNVAIGSGAVATNATDGFLYVTACAGTPTGTPTAKTGRIPIVADSTNNKLYIFSGGAWVALN